MFKGVKHFLKPKLIFINCRPYDQPGCRINDLEDPKTLKCFATGKPATAWVLWGRSY